MARREETDEDYVIEIRWTDGLFESFNARQIRVSESLLWLRLRDGRNRNIPLQNVRWYSIYPEIHGEAKLEG